MAVCLKDYFCIAQYIYPIKADGGIILIYIFLSLRPMSVKYLEYIPLKEECRMADGRKILRNFEWCQVSLGGATDASILEGHSYTYVGSTWGRHGFCCT